MSSQEGRLEISRKLDASRGFKRAFRRLTETIDGDVPSVMVEQDPVALHDVRVAVRRTRALLTEGSDLWKPKTVKEHRDLFRWLGRVTGPARDLDVHLADWSSLSGDDEMLPPALHRLRREVNQQRADAYRSLIDALQGARAVDGLAAWRSWTADEKAKAGVALGTVVGRRIGRAQRRIIRRGRAITLESPPEDLHDLRKEAKVLRALFEAFGALFPAKPLRTLVAELRDLQGNLGEHQDAAVQLSSLRVIAGQLDAAAPSDRELRVAVAERIDLVDQTRMRVRNEFADRFARYGAASSATLATLLDALD